MLASSPAHAGRRDMDEEQTRRTEPDYEARLSVTIKYLIFAVNIIYR